MAARQLAAHFTPRKKVLVVDLDNTLWGGILGEDGPDGIAFRPDNYRGRIFSAALTFIKALSETGILLAIASKNNEAEVRAVFAREDFPLKWQDIAAHRINWHPKPDNLRELAAELNLGLDSFVFLDDSPAECTLVRRTLPQVSVVQVPDVLSKYPDCLRALAGFDRPRLTHADRERKADYQQAQERRELAASSTDLDAFVRELKIRLVLGPATASSLDRVTQLFERTNQFNLSGLRYRREELQCWVDDPERLLCVDYTDRFGSSGLIGALVFGHSDRVASVDGFVLSCRVLGRKVEHAIVAAAGGMFRAHGRNAIRFQFQASDRNQPARDFLLDIGATPSEDLEISRLCHPAIDVVWRTADHATNQP
jgi:FkbH-like protein